MAEEYPEVDWDSWQKRTQEEDYAHLNEFMRKYHPYPGNFCCEESEKMYFERLDIVNRNYAKAHAERFSNAQAAPTSTLLQPENPAAKSQCSEEHISESIAAVIGNSTIDKDAVSARGGRMRHKSEKLDSAQNQTFSTRSRSNSVSRPSKEILPKTPIPKEPNEPEKSTTPKESTKEPPSRPAIPKAQQVWIPSYKMSYGGARSVCKVTEHQRFVGMLCSLQDEGKLRFSKENNQEYQKMKDKLQREQQKFNEFVKNVAEKELVRANQFLPKQWKDYIVKCLKKKAEATTEKLPHLYSWLLAYAIQFPMQDPPRLEFESLLLSVGTAHVITVPDLTRKVTVCVDDIPEIETLFPISERAEEGLISEDPNFSTLLQKYGASFVACVKAVRFLMLGSGPFSSDECYLPIVVRPAYIQGRKQNVIYLSKPLPPATMSKRQLYSYHAKLAFKTCLFGAGAVGSSKTTDANTSSIIDSFDESFLPEQDSQNQFGSEYAGSPDDSFDLSNDGFPRNDDTGVMGDSEMTATISSYNLRRGETNTGADETGMDISTKRKRHLSVSSASRTFSKKPRGRPPMKQVAATDASRDLVGEIMSGMTSVRPTGNASLLRQAQARSHMQQRIIPKESSNEYVPPAKRGSMREYTLWKLKEFQLLIRSNVDGVVKKPSADNMNVMRASVSAKVEYLPSYGAEKQTQEEELYDCLSMFLKSSEVHYRGHIKFDQDYDLLAVVTQKKNQISLAMETLKIEGMRRLYGILRGLTRLDEGNYILRLRKTEPSQISIYRPLLEKCDTVDQSMTIDIGQTDKASWPKLDAPTFAECWREIDPTVVFQWHRIVKRIPATFPPCRDGEEPKDWANLKKSKRKPKKKIRKQAQSRYPKRNAAESPGDFI